MGGRGEGREREIWREDGGKRGKEEKDVLYIPERHTCASGAAADQSGMSVDQSVNERGISLAVSSGARVGFISYHTVHYNHIYHNSISPPFSTTIIVSPLRRQREREGEREGKKKTHTSPH